MEGLDKLGFSDFTKDASSILNECKIEAAKRRKHSNRLENLGISEEELLRQQQELIQQARDKMNEEFKQQQFGLQAQTFENTQNCDDDDDEDY